MKPDQFFNRELSWLAFNERVLEEAAKDSLPVLERVKFLAITASNLDEFFMVRVGGLQFLKDANKRVRDLAGLTPTQQLAQIRERTLHFIDTQYEILNLHLRPLLRDKGIRRMMPDELTPGQRTYLHEYFNEQIFPVLSPIAVDPDEERIALPALQILLMSEVRAREEEKAPETVRYVVFTLPPSLSRHVVIPDVEGATHSYINVEDLVEMFIHQYFPQEQVHGTARFRISRNSDITLDDESAQDLAAEMEQILVARQSSSTIRLEIEEESDVTPSLVKSIQRLCDVNSSQTYMIPGELDLRSCFGLASLPGFENLKVAPWPTSEIQEAEDAESIFDLIREDDLLLHHPYESFEPVLQLVEQAAADPNVIAIKQILYRTAKNSRIISALIKAAQAGKHVTVLVELKARFDEARNLERAEDLLNAGAQIIYGVRGLKTHAKICLVLRRESGRMMRYCHFGTGNYNEATSRLYTDISYLTCRPEYGADATSFFHTVTGRSRFVHFQRISMAPFGLRERLVEMIQSETERARQGEAAEMKLKMNSLEDPQMIQELYAASKAGVKVHLCVRGICCLRPGVKGLSENIRVISIIDRYLEHGRIFWFRQGGNPVVFIASADFMNRNLSKRVELLTPIEDADARKRLEEILDTQFADTVQARDLDKDGVYLPVKTLKRKPLRSQEYFAKQAARRHRSRSQSPDLLVPHVPK